ncbi:MAG: hypothetical protein QNJ38_01345 [Prochloraceae cyanobacterium]|nr:hypothetical protein [Prochloraceae cyanobacterium]
MFDFSKLQNPIAGTAQNFADQGETVSVQTDIGTFKCEALTDITSTEVIVFKDNSGKYYALGERSQVIQEETTQFFKSRINPISPPKPRYALLFVVLKNTEEAIDGILGNDRQSVAGEAPGIQGSRVCITQPTWRTLPNAINGDADPRPFCNVGTVTQFGNVLGNATYYLYNSVTNKTTELLTIAQSEALTFIVDLGVIDNTFSSNVLLATTSEEIRVNIFYTRLQQGLPSTFFEQDPTQQDPDPFIHITSYNTLTRYIFKWGDSDNFQTITVNYPDKITDEQDPNQSKDWNKPLVELLYENPISAYDGTFTSDTYLERLQSGKDISFKGFLKSMNEAYFLVAGEVVDSPRSGEVGRNQDNILNFKKNSSIGNIPNPLYSENGLKTLGTIYQSIFIEKKAFQGTLKILRVIGEPGDLEPTEFKSIPITLKPITDIDEELDPIYDRRASNSANTVQDTDFLEDAQLPFDERDPDYPPKVGFRMYFSFYIDASKL